MFTDARGPLFRLPCSETVRRLQADASVVADKSESVEDAAELTLGLSGHRASSTLRWRHIQLFVTRRTIAVYRCAHTTSTLASLVSPNSYPRR